MRLLVCFEEAIFFIVADCEFHSLKVMVAFSTLWAWVAITCDIYYLLAFRELVVWFVCA